jgi:hypothetical protein
MPVPVSETMVLKYFASSSIDTEGFKKSVSYVFIINYWHQFVAVLEVAELFCTFVSDTAIGMITLSQGPLQRK